MKKYIPFISWVIGFVLECITVSTGVAWLSIPAMVFVIAGYATDRWSKNVDDTADK